MCNFKLSTFVTLMMLMATGVSVASTVEVGNNGDLRVSSKATSWKNTNVYIAPEVLSYGNEWEKAYKTPGKIVPIKLQPVSKRGLFHMTESLVVEVGIVYKNNRIDLVHNVTIGSHTRFTLQLFFSIVALLFVMVFLIWFLGWIYRWIYLQKSKNPI